MQSCAKVFALVAAVVAAAAVLAACGGGGTQSDGTITGVQTAASEQLVRAWGAGFAKAANVETRAPVGDVAGRFAAGTADFAVSDEPLDPSDRGNADAVAIPVALSPVAIAYNVVTFAGKRVPTGVWFDGLGLAGVFDGVKFNWAQTRFIYRNNARLGLRLPDELFQVCRDPGPTAINTALTTYLTRSSPTWAKSPGIAARPAWPKLEVPAVDTADVAGCVKRSAGGIGYTALADARRKGLTVASLEAPNGRGPFFAPEAPGYPIQMPELVLVRQDMCNAGLTAKAAANVRAWLDYALGARGQAIAARYGYRPLAAAARSRARAQVAALRCDGRPISGRRV